METAHLSDDEPQMSETLEMIESEQPLQELDMSPEARLARIASIQGRMAAGETIDPSEVNPRTHSPELVALVHQSRKRGGVDIHL